MARTWARVAACVLLATAALASGGCVAVVAGAAAAGGAGGYAYYKGKVSRSYVANFDDVWNATRTSLSELGMPVSGEQRNAMGGTIDSKAGSERVQITFEVQTGRPPAEGPLTSVGVRVATFGDESLSNRILDRISAHLPLAPGAIPPPLPQPPGGPVTLSKPVESAAPPLATPGK